MYMSRARLLSVLDIPAMRFILVVTPRFLKRSASSQNIRSMPICSKVMPSSFFFSFGAFFYLCLKPLL